MRFTLQRIDSGNFYIYDRKTEVGFVEANPASFQDKMDGKQTWIVKLYESPTVMIVNQDTRVMEILEFIESAVE